MPPVEGYTLEEHTADLWLISVDTELGGIIRNSINGLYSVMASRYIISGSKEEKVHLEGSTYDEILIDALTEALYLFDAESMLMIDPKFEVHEVEMGIEVIMKFRGAKAEIPEGAHGMEIKAATYHGAEVISVPEGYRSKILLDL